MLLLHSIPAYASKALRSETIKVDPRDSRPLVCCATAHFSSRNWTSLADAVTVRPSLRICPHARAHGRVRPPTVAIREPEGQTFRLKTECIHCLKVHSRSRASRTRNVDCTDAELLTEDLRARFGKVQWRQSLLFVPGSIGEQLGIADVKHFRIGKSHLRFSLRNGQKTRRTNRPVRPVFVQAVQIYPGYCHSFSPMRRSIRETKVAVWSLLLTPGWASVSVLPYDSSAQAQSCRARVQGHCQNAGLSFSSRKLLLITSNHVAVCSRTYPA